MPTCSRRSSRVRCSYRAEFPSVKKASMESDGASVVGHRESGASTTLKRWLWGESATIVLLLAVSTVVLLGRLGTAELWTQEGRWAAICTHMIDSGDYGHPYLLGEPYYDKPLLSYWLMIGAAPIPGRL